MAEKIELVKQLLDTNDIDIIKSIKSILSGSTQSSDNWTNLPSEVIEDIKDAIGQVEAGDLINHLEAQETYKKWL
ncbi:hypothetical protein [Pedobacter alpinus]|uniref:Uncharacterized protein n=1 Tax=Pedobacter alpinus TaxID=1590643 RepID=A0ABW5TPX1_9SPHI